ncbi:MAG: hypothetical protein PVH29_09045 [Candidatus Zixiibacteriota bacterium]|jgi:hypothetical protein
MAIEIPRNIEVLIKKAAVDTAFKKALFAERAGAAAYIALDITPAEAAMLKAVPESQLRAIVGRTRVSPNLRPAFLGAAAATMLAALAAAGCKDPAAEYGTVDVKSKGIRPDYPPQPETAETAETADTGGSGTLAPDVGTGLYSGGNGTVTGGGAGGGLGGIRPDSDLKNRPKGFNVNIVDVVVVPPAVGAPFRDTADVREEVNTFIPDMRMLYAVMSNNGDAPKHGKMVIGFNIKAVGSVYDVAVIGSNVSSSTFSDAVVREVGSWHFRGIDEGNVSAAATIIFSAESN